MRSPNIAHHLSYRLVIAHDRSAVKKIHGLSSKNMYMRAWKDEQETVKQENRVSKQPLTIEGGLRSEKDIGF